MHERLPFASTADRTCLIATLGTEPQVVTLTLQALFAAWMRP